MSETYTDPVIIASAGMESDYSDVRMEAARRMGQTDFMQCARYLFSMALYDASLEVRTTAANALEYMDHDAAVAGLDFEARMPDAEHRVAAIKLLGRRRDSGSIKTLGRVLIAREQSVRQAALRALEQIGGEVAAKAICSAPIPPHLEVDERLDTLGRMKQRCAVPFLAGIVKQGHWRSTPPAIQALGRIGDPSALGIVLEAAGHDATPVRYEAITALRRLGVPAAVPTLCAACGDENPGVRKAARDALGILKAKETTAFLCEALSLDSRRLRLGALRRLSERQDPAAAACLWASMEDEDEEVASGAWNALANLEVRESFALLSSVLNASPRLCLGAVRRLGKLGDPAAIPTLIAFLVVDDSAICAAATTALGRMRASEAAEEVARLLTHPEVDVRLAAAIALSDLGRRSVLPAIRERLRTFGGEPEAQVRIALKHALRQIEAETEERADLPLAAGVPSSDAATLPTPVQGLGVTE